MAAAEKDKVDSTMSIGVATMTNAADEPHHNPQESRMPWLRGPRTLPGKNAITRLGNRVPRQSPTASHISNDKSILVR